MYQSKHRLYTNILSIEPVSPCALKVGFDLGFGIMTVQRIVLEDYYPPSAQGPQGPRGKLAFARLVEIFSQGGEPEILDTQIFVNKSKSGYAGYSGDVRLLTKVSDSGAKWIKLSKALVDEGWGVDDKKALDPNFNFLEHAYPLLTDLNVSYYRSRILPNTTHEMAPEE